MGIWCSTTRVCRVTLLPFLSPAPLAIIPPSSHPCTGRDSWTDGGRATWPSSSMEGTQCKREPGSPVDSSHMNYTGFRSLLATCTRCFFFPHLLSAHSSKASCSCTGCLLSCFISARAVLALLAALHLAMVDANSLTWGAPILAPPKCCQLSPPCTDIMHIKDARKGLGS